jgi:hypothetical protein
MLCKRWGSTPKKSHLISPLSTNTGRRRRGRTRGAWLSKYCVGCGGQPRVAPRSHRRAPQSQCGGLEGGPAAMTTGVACFFRHAIHLRPGMVTMRSTQLLFFAGRDKGAGDLIVLEGEDTRDLFPNTVQVCNGDDISLLHVSFSSTLESLPLQWCSQPLTGNSFAIERLGNLFSFPVLLILSLPLLFLEMMTTLVMFVWRC